MTGDDAFEAEALAHLDFVYSVARRLVASRTEAEDLVQETYLRALPAWRERSPDNPQAWLATICRNAARDAWRRAAVRPVEVSDDLRWTDEPSTTDTAASAIANLDAQAVHRALWRLSPAMREAINLVDLAGLTHEEAAQVLGVPRGTVLSRVHRGRKLLAAMIKQEVSDVDA